MERAITVLITGGRTYSDAGTVSRVLRSIHDRRPVGLLVEGGATGADALGRQWAQTVGVPHRTHHALWNTPAGFDAYAGRKRNVSMHDTERPDLVVAFPGGISTSHMIAHVVSRGTPVLRVSLSGALRLRA